MTPRPTFERVWFAYLAAVAAIAVVCSGSLAPGALWSHLGVHAVVFTAVAGTHWIAVRRSHDAARWPRAALAIVGLPVVFSAMAWLIPSVHPEPFEWACRAMDRAMFGDDAANLADPWLSRPLNEVLQLVYATFYVLPIAACLAVKRGAGSAAFDRAVLAFVVGFLASYLGYLLVPTLGPKVVLAYERPVEGVWLAESVRRAIDAGEANPWDCFPSGHTWLAVTSLVVTWRWNRRWFLILLVPALVLIASTVLLRYHWVVDVMAGAGAAWPFVRLCDHLADRDGWPAPITSS